MKNNLIRVLSGSSLGAVIGAALIAASPTSASAYAEPELKCTETVTRVVCCVVDGDEVLDCAVMPK
jgi:hypothetical protein